MNIRRIICSLSFICLFGCSESAEEQLSKENGTSGEKAIVKESVEQEAKKAEGSSFVAADFEVPISVDGPGFKLAPLGPELVTIDYEAYMSSIEHLQTTYTRSTNWPHEGLTDADAMLDMQTEQKRFQNRESFAYGVLTPDGSRERGSVYVRPSKKVGYDAQVSMWVTKADFDAGFDAELFEWVQGWVPEAWEFTNVAYPGRLVEWAQWDALPTIGETQELLTFNTNTAEQFITAFYSFDPDLLRPLLTSAGASSKSILYYQGWAEGGNYKIVKRGTCEAESPELVRCAITVQDDPVLALKTGFNVTDTFALSFKGTQIVSIDTSSDDQPIYYEAREWVVKNMPEVISGPCKGRGEADYEGELTPGDCARAMTEGYRKFYAAKTGA